MAISTRGPSLTGIRRLDAPGLSTPSLRSRLAARPQVPAAALAAVAGVITLYAALALDLPLRDPDGIAGPAYVRLPLIMTLLIALDILPRSVWRARGAGPIRRELVAVMHERWPRQRVMLVVVGLLSFYVTYVSYRNLKSFLPFVRYDLADPALLELDRALLGADPAALLQGVLGTGAVAYVLSAVYVFFLIFVPISLGAALVWTRDVARGFWFVTALGINWMLGALSYYLLPSLGPVFVQPASFAGLPSTGVSRLQEALLGDRYAVLTDPHATEAMQGVAGFASLHVSIVFTAALIAHLVGLRLVVRIVLWAFLVLTCLATVYFGWHYLIDDAAGLVIGALAVWLGALATGHEVRFTRRSPASV